MAISQLRRSPLASRLSRRTLPSALVQAHSAMDQLYAHEKYAAAAKQALGLSSEIFDRAVCLGSEPVFKVDGGYSGGSNPTLLLLPKGQCDMGYPQNGPMKAVPVECCGVIGEAAIASCVREQDM